MTTLARARAAYARATRRDNWTYDPTQDESTRDRANAHATRRRAHHIRDSVRLWLAYRRRCKRNGITPEKLFLD